MHIDFKEKIKTVYIHKIILIYLENTKEWPYKFLGVKNNVKLTE